jgi:hypothetical protein
MYLQLKVVWIDHMYCHPYIKLLCNIHDLTLSTVGNVYYQQIATPNVVNAHACAAPIETEINIVDNGRYGGVDTG